MRRQRRRKASASVFLSCAAALLVGGGMLVSPFAFAITPEQVQALGWLEVRKPPALLTAEWLSARYGVKIASLDVRQFAAPSASISVCTIALVDPAMREKLWTALERDRTPDQALAREDGRLILLISADPGERDKVLSLVKADRKAESASRFAWLVDELPRQVPDLAFAQAYFRHDLMALETKIGAALDAVYQVDYRFRAARLDRQLSQVAFWIPRDPAKAKDLVRAVERLRPEAQALLTGKGAVAVVLSFNDEGRQRLVALLQSKGYRVEAGSASGRPGDVDAK